MSAVHIFLLTYVRTESFPTVFNFSRVVCSLRLGQVFVGGYFIRTQQILVQHTSAVSCGLIDGQLLPNFASRAIRLCPLFSVFINRLWHDVMIKAVPPHMSNVWCLRTIHVMFAQDSRGMCKGNNTNCVSFTTSSIYVYLLQLYDKKSFGFYTTELYYYLRGTIVNRTKYCQQKWLNIQFLMYHHRSY